LNFSQTSLFLLIFGDKKMDLRSRATDTNFRVGNWYKNQSDPLKSGRLVRENGDQVILSRMGRVYC